MAPGFLRISPSGALRSPYSTNLSAEKLISRICESFDGGSFPASAGVVSELSTMASDPKTPINSVADVVLHDPTLALRVVHHVNQQFFPGEHAVATVSEAVLQIGMKGLCDQCSNYVLMQKFVPNGTKSATFSDAMRNTICTAVLTSKLIEKKYDQDSAELREFGFLLGTLYEIGPLLLAFHFPQVYEAALSRAKAKQIGFERALRELCGFSPTQLSARVAERLSLHSLYYATLCMLTGSSVEARINNSDLSPGELAMLVEGAAELTAMLFSPKADRGSELPALAASLGLNPAAVKSLLAEIPVILRRYCDWMQISLATLPLLIGSESAAGTTDSGARRVSKLAAAVEDLHKAIEGGEPLSSIITGTMEAMRDLLRYDRVLFMQLDQSKISLRGRLFLGSDSINPHAFVRKLSPASPEGKAVIESRPVFDGIPLLEGAACFAVLPVGFGEKCIGLLYADHTTLGTVKNINERERAAISVFGELLDRALAIPA